MVHAISMRQIDFRIFFKLKIINRSRLTTSYMLQVIYYIYHILLNNQQYIDNGKFQIE